MTIDELKTAVEDVKQLTDKVQNVLELAFTDGERHIDVASKLADILKNVNVNATAVLMLFFAEKYIQMKTREEMAESVMESLMNARPSEEDAEVQPSHEQPVTND